MVLLVAFVYGRRSESQTFLQTHAMPPDLGSVLYIAMADADADLAMALKALNELLAGRAGYPASAIARAAAKLLIQDARVSTRGNGTRLLHSVPANGAPPCHTLWPKKAGPQRNP